MPRSLVALARCVLIAAAATAASAQGVPSNGFPKWEERVLHEWTNRARCDPQVEMTACGAPCSEAACYAPKPPLAYSLALNRAARYHCDEMQARGFFAHDSNCTLVTNIDALYPASCAGAAACACVGGVNACSGACTTWNSRVGLFGATSSGEVQVSSSDPNTAFYTWLYNSNLGATACSQDSNNQHRWAILMLTGSVGAGTSAAGSTMDFGPAGTPSRIPSAAHYPRQAASVEVWANWFDAAGPSQAAVNVDGVFTPLTLRRGTASNGAWSATITGVGTGCHRYYFDFRDAGGALVRYPSSGSFAIGTSGCPDWDPSSPGNSGTISAAPLTLGKGTAPQLVLTWGASCSSADGDFEVYEGALGSFTSHAPLTCSTAGALTATVTPGGGNRYYLVVPATGIVEGSYGKNRAGVQRPPATSSCLPPSAVACP